MTRLPACAKPAESVDRAHGRAGSPQTILILGVDPVLLDAGPEELPEAALQGYFDFLWTITDGRIETVIEQTLAPVTATAVHFVEAGYNYKRAGATAGASEEQILHRILRQLPHRGQEIALVVCGREQVERLAAELSPHAAQVKTIQAPPLDSKRP